MFDNSHQTNILLLKFIFYPLETVSRYRNEQLQEKKNRIIFTFGLRRINLGHTLLNIGYTSLKKNTEK